MNTEPPTLERTASTLLLLILPITNILSQSACHRAAPPLEEGDSQSPSIVIEVNPDGATEIKGHPLARKRTAAKLEKLQPTPGGRGTPPASEPPRQDTTQQTVITDPNSAIPTAVVTPQSVSSGSSTPTPTPTPISMPSEKSDWRQEAYIKASNAGAYDFFGWSISLSGHSLAVGSFYEDSAQTTITHGSSAPYDNSAENAGAVYIFGRTGNTWSQQAYIKASNGGGSTQYGSWQGDRFGESVSLSGDVLSVGAIEEDSSQTVITNEPTASTNNSLYGSGAVYVFRRSASLWSQEAYVKASNAGLYDNFGHRVSVSGNALAVSSVLEDSAQSTIHNGASAPPPDNSAGNSGAVFTYVRNESTWAQDAYVKAKNADPGDEFGTSVHIFGDTLVVGARGESSTQRVITNGNLASSDNTLPYSGAVYVYRRSGLLWYQEAYIKAANADEIDNFGYSLSLSGDTLAVSAHQEASPQRTITNGPEASADNDSDCCYGAVYVYRRSGSQWVQEAYVKASNAIAHQSFGSAVALSGNTLAVGAPGDWSAQNFVTNNSTSSLDTSMHGAGAAFVYRREGKHWSQEAYIKAPQPDSSDRFGHSVSLSGDTLAISAPYERSAQNTILNGAGGSADNSLDASGAVYIFRNSGRLFDPDVHISGRERQALTISWQASLGTVQYIKLATATAGESTPEDCTIASAITIPVAAKNFRYTGLEPGQKYGFRVCAFDGTWSSPGTLIWDETLP